MKIYIVFPGPLYPIQGMSQVRMLNQLKSLVKDHSVVFSDLVSQASSVDLAKQHMDILGVEYLPLYSSSFGKGRLFRILRAAIRAVLYNIRTISREELALGSAILRKQLLCLISSSGADAVMIHYWYLGNLFSHLDRRILCMVDTHYVVEENIELLPSCTGSKYFCWKQKHELLHSLKMQRQYFAKSDLVIVNSARQKELIMEWNQSIAVQVTCNGQDLREFLEFKAEGNSELAVGFYGSLANQFNRRALKRVLTEIYPRLLSAIPTLKLYIIGANPPMELINQHMSDTITVTGFVEDIKPYIAKCRVILMPLDTGSGFRGRTVEVMALGVPVVGTNNALQSIGFISGKHGFIAEEDTELASGALEILRNAALYHEFSQNSRDFAAKEFSLEATFGVLSSRIGEMQINGRTNRIYQEK